MRKRTFHSRPGFTIVELLIVIVVIAILAALSIISFRGVTHRATVAAVVSEVSQVSKRISIDYPLGNYPDDISSLDLQPIDGSRYVPIGGGFCFSIQRGDVKFKATNLNPTPHEGVCESVDDIVPKSELAKLLASDGQTSDTFGISADVSGDTAVIGAYYDDDNGNNSGSAYIFARLGGEWVQQAKLLPNDGYEGDRFGSSVAISGDTVAVGSPYSDSSHSNSGAVYVFTKSSGVWSQRTKIQANDGQTEALLGQAISMDGNTIIAGAYYDDSVATNSGSAYIFTGSGASWVQQAKLTASDGAVNDLFGWSVSINGDTAIIGSIYDDDRGSDSGSVYAYSRTSSTWSLQAKIAASNGAAGDRFGSVLALHGDIAVVSAPAHNGSGAVYVIQKVGSSWSELQVLASGSGNSSDGFGVSVAVHGDVISIGANRDVTDGINSGVVYVYYRNNDSFSLHRKLRSDSSIAGMRFGASVALDEKIMIVGASADTGEVAGAGSAYVFIPSSE